MDDRQFSVGGANGWRFLDVSSRGSEIALDYRILADVSWHRDVEFHLVHENTAGPSMKPIKSETVAPVETNFDPWVWRHTFLVRGGHGVVRIRAMVGASQLLEDEINLGSLDPLTTQATLQRNPPRLVLDINDTPRSFPFPQAATEAEKVGTLLVRIRQNLGRPLSDNAWLGPNTGRGLHLGDTALTAEQLRDERLARRVSEMLLVVPYSMPGTIYSCSDSAMYNRIAARLAAGQEGFFASFQDHAAT